ncbi:hypothetical protein L1987_74984 [Smallanthus sonchifolius]|uniref:Uncharacterized protein n=1 Tax=Smallanthus sonchifolius TaxID=185202 RepID=A0ACB9A5E8_9ASTR|nr:hypothetical protein L1987_74984 [Smallanthus sonchifolius]
MLQPFLNERQFHEVFSLTMILKLQRSYKAQKQKGVAFEELFFVMMFPGSINPQDSWFYDVGHLIFLIKVTVSDEATMS